MTHMDDTLDSTWDDPLPHALTETRTYLASPSSQCDVAVIALHGKGDNADDFCQTFVPHLCAFFASPHLVNGPVDLVLDQSTQRVDSQIRITLRAIQALDGIWFPTHKPRNEAEVTFQSPYVYSSLLKISDEIAFLQSCGITTSKMILVGFSQGAILVNSYLVQALHSRLVIPANVLGWAGSCFAFQTPFPRKGWCWTNNSHTDADLSLSLASLKVLPNPGSHVQVQSHQQCGSSDAFFTLSELEHTAASIALAGQTNEDLLVHVSVTMEPGGHAVLPGMVAKLIQMIQNVHHAHSAQNRGQSHSDDT